MPLPAHADAESEAETLFATGRQARLDGDCVAAIGSFSRAIEIYPQGLGSLRNIAECQEDLGQYASARRSYWDLRRAAMRAVESKYQGWAEWAEQAHARLEPKVSRLTIELAGEPDLRKLAIVLEGKPLDPRLIGVVLERDPGTIEISLSYGGSEPVVRRVELREGSAETVTLRAPERPDTVGPPSPTPNENTGAWQTAGIASLAVAGTSLAAMFVSIAIRQEALGSLEDGCAAYETEPCPSSVQGAIDRGELAAALVNVFGVTAAVGAGVGITFLLMSSDDPGAAPTPSSNGAFVSITGSF
jgi:hypothetical protein